MRQSGDLELTATTEIRKATHQFEVTGQSRFTSDVYVGGTDLYVDTVNNRIGMVDPQDRKYYQAVINSICRKLCNNRDCWNNSTTLRETLGIGNDFEQYHLVKQRTLIQNRDEGELKSSLNGKLVLTLLVRLRLHIKVIPTISAGYSGVVGIKEDSSAAMDVNGDLVASGDGRVVGVPTIGQGAEQVTFGTTNAQINGTLIGNVSAIAGFSIFQDVIVQGNVSVGSSFGCRWSKFFYKCYIRYTQ